MVVSKHLLMVVAAGAMTLGTAASFTSAISPSLAADVIPPAEPIVDWTGPYIGVHAGYAWVKWHGEDTEGIPPLASVTLEDNNFIFGGQLGYNWQVAPSFVLGMETDATWLDVSDEDDSDFNFESIETDWLATVRGRAGFAMDHIMVYATGGVAFSDTEVEDEDSDAEQDETLFGWTAGGGVEVLLAQNVTAKAEYLYIQFDEEEFEVPGLASDIDLHAHIIRTGVNYKFGW